MRTIYKYPMQVTDIQNLSIPGHRRPLHVGLDPQGMPCLWAEVEPDTIPIPMVIAFVGTGHPVPHDMIYIGSFVIDIFVFHIYYK